VRKYRAGNSCNNQRVSDSEEKCGQ
jgi:hypothetical protein